MPNSTVYVSPDLRPQIEACKFAGLIKKWLNGAPISTVDTQCLRGELAQQRKSNEPSTLDRGFAWLKSQPAKRKKAPLEQTLENITLYTITENQAGQLSFNQSHTNALKLLDDIHTFRSLPTLQPLTPTGLLNAVSQQSNQSDDCLTAFKHGLEKSYHAIQLIIDPNYVQTDELPAESNDNDTPLATLCVILQKLIVTINAALNPSSTLSDCVAQLEAAMKLRSDLICKSVINSNNAAQENSVTNKLNRKIITLIHTIIDQLPSKEQITAFDTTIDDAGLKTRVIHSLAKLQRYTIHQCDQQTNCIEQALIDIKIWNDSSLPIDKAIYESLHTAMQERITGLQSEYQAKITAATRIQREARNRLANKKRAATQIQRLAREVSAKTITSATNAEASTTKPTTQQQRSTSILISSLLCLFNVIFSVLALLSFSSRPAQQFVNKNAVGKALLTA